MTYLNLTGSSILSLAEGCTNAEIKDMEVTLGRKIPLAVVEYLLTFGKKQHIFSEYDLHGCEDMSDLVVYFESCIKMYEDKGIDMSIAKGAIPFLNFVDTTFFIPDLVGNDDPPIFSLEIGETPEIQKRSDKFSQFIYDWISKRLSGEFL